MESDIITIFKYFVDAAGNEDELRGHNKKYYIKMQGQFLDFFFQRQ